jgi:cytochrome c peroxidase
MALLFAGALFIISADKKTAPDPKPTYLIFKIPAGWPKPGFNIFENNRLSEQGFQLGRMLFYDGRLSKDGNFACAGCHQQFAAFSTFDHDLSHGFGDKFTKRNAPGIFNLAWTPLLQWDGGINHIEVQPLAPLTAHNEMAESVDSILIKLRKDRVYRKMFKAAFGDETINSQRMLKALAQFTGSILSANSKYDKVKRGEATFTNIEQRGYEQFKAKCNSCHAEPLFTDNSFRNSGFAMSDYLKDEGRKTITGLSEDSLKFKVPSLRNLVYTFPYMHDGRTYSLGQAIDHYRNGIVQSTTLDSSLKKGIALDKFERNDLLYFLRTLTDSSLVINKRFSDPVPGRKQGLMQD